MNKIRQISKPNINILGWQPDDVVKKYMSTAKAFVYAACEDFGIALVEAQACGTPVIAFGAGGALETVRDIRSSPRTGTGVLFKTQTIAAIIEAVREFETCIGKFDSEYTKEHAAQFGAQVFARRYVEFVNGCEEKSKETWSMKS